MRKIRTKKEFFWMLYMIVLFSVICALLFGCSIHVKTVDIVTVIIVDSKIQPEILTNKSGIKELIKGVTNDKLAKVRN